MPQILPVENINGLTPAWQIGLTIKNGGLITINTELDFYFKALHIKTGGDVLVRGVDGKIIPFLGMLSGSWVCVLGNAVVSAATVDGQALTTTAADIAWYGGF